MHVLDSKNGLWFNIFELSIIENLANSRYSADLFEVQLVWAKKAVLTKQGVRLGPSLKFMEKVY